MAFLSETAAAVAAGARIRAARLLKFEFQSSTQYLWEGVGRLQADGHEWIGFGQLGGMEGLEQARSGDAPMATFWLSGVDPTFVTYAAGSQAEIKNRPVTVYLQFFDENLAVLDAPYAFYVGLMDVMRFSADGPRGRKIAVTAETAFVDGASAPYGYLTDVDQKARFPGDRGLEYVASLRAKTVNWLRG